ncbi:hypothetical protein V5735_22705 (plasmid) [Haladaptatus sp. SPP-AMP-3]|uniref:hypothetical protein n=1 Tax=Haladaptatus sp. SPP-AMP-3 TaxID=3121295 RepID=UPI003C2FB00D
MPLTPFHLGIGLFLGLACYRWLDFPTLCVGTVIVDTRSIAIYFGPFTGNLHGPLHTLIGGTFLAGVLAAAMFKLKPYWNLIAGPVGLAQNRSISKILAASIVGVYTHLILDAIMHSDMQPFYPLEGNPLYGALYLSDLYVICFSGFLFGFLLYPIHVYRWKRGPILRKFSSE